MKIIPHSKQTMLAELSKRSGGIPDFAKKAFEQMGLKPEDIEKADQLGKAELESKAGGLG